MVSKRCGICDRRLTPNEELASRKEVCVDCGVRGGLNVIDNNGRNFLDRMEYDIEVQIERLQDRLHNIDEYRKDDSWVLVKTGESYFTPKQPIMWMGSEEDE
ncbi:hypothetical protein BPS13_0177 [Bacillus phage BPS13]|uniref:Uncharacterized protein n=3 Tax=Wphvirus TaxID=1922327 RepID=W5QUK3_9CAUD|nr:hypothetical protein [Bacillus thuringiensis]YP_006907736.1 hypothetical protein BPS13_0177 [Bacillus phage BPS13]YP_009003062.1 hypothetical protein BPS10C_176 [Bacillus phage BPS10C]YP_009282130.1 hypothetical protein SALINJAH_176 [Bacillus phage SalinJah]AEZ50356.1 hypothetical protein BPS13_0177 [Bacillus phage BPS13]AGI12173.1 hypothetical protein BPS10C_176 [Bacillus phage BPS10C]ANH50627.1 hypothetical protein SALINJAH_176 [Bacillus phage SalinJah]OTZ47844.1 hypothetical protein BK